MLRGVSILLVVTVAGPPTITISATGMSPLELTIAVGQRVTFVNNDNRAHDVVGGVDPNHPDCPEIVQAQNREFYGNLEAYLFEATWRVQKHALYARAEHVAKDILDAGFHPIGTAHTHRQSPIGALTLGYSRDLVPSARWGSLALGGDITGYSVPANLETSYGSPLSFHVFVRLRARAGRLAHIH